jgi:hypothetical protein
MRLLIALKHEVSAAEDFDDSQANPPGHRYAAATIPGVTLAAGGAAVRVSHGARRRRTGFREAFHG